jgi:signal transduction histidine kinase
MQMNVEKLNEAFDNFTRASQSLESYYGQLQDRIAYLTRELESKNQRLNQALAETEQSKDYLNAVLYNIEEAIVVVDPDNGIAMMNRSAEMLFRTTAGEAAGKLFSELDFVLTHDGSETMLTVKGKKYSVIVSHSNVVDAAGRLRGSVDLIKDITRLRELEVQHERNQRLISMGEMAAKIVHEIRNPLCSIELFATMLEKELSGTCHRDLAQGISAGIGSLNTILTNMLFFARPRKPAFKVIDLENIVSDVLTIMAPLLNSRKVVCERETVPCPVHGDAELLKQVIMNIIMNAVQAMPEGGSIGMTLTRSERGGAVHISDSGEGIAQENVEKIFDPFFTTKDAGTGLGLAITSKIMQAHNGCITVQSEVGKGSTFSLLFPSPGPSIENNKTAFNNQTACDGKKMAVSTSVIVV